MSAASGVACRCERMYSFRNWRSAGLYVSSPSTSAKKRRISSSKSMRSHRQATPDAALINLFRECCESVYEVLGGSPFKLEQSRNFVNKAMFDAIMVPVAFSNRDELRANATEVAAIITELPNDGQFRTAIGRATADRRRMLFRIGLVADRLRKAGVTVSLDEGLGLSDFDVSAV